MFSTKEYFAIFGAGVALSLLYFVCRFSIAINVDAAEVVGGIAVFLQCIPFLIYSALTVIHVFILYLSRKFMDRSVEGDFKKTYKLFNYSEVLTVASILGIFVMSMDIPNYVNILKADFSMAVKLSFFPYWLTCTLFDRWNYAIMWHLPFTVFSIVLELITYKKYFKAKQRFTYLYPSV
ncbi:MAG: hypothetical protein K2N36_08780, partial [Ruminiclostridium sp.]|nr:hypothetical protein [Ruminiclostridium sp.]